MGQAVNHFRYQIQHYRAKDNNNDNVTTTTTTMMMMYYWSSMPVAFNLG
jgi:hypothetical protein